MTHQDRPNSDTPLATIYVILVASGDHDGVTTVLLSAVDPSHGGSVYPVLGALHPEQPLGAHLDAGNGSEVIGWHRANLGAANSCHAFPPVSGAGLATGHLRVLLVFLQRLPGLDDVVLAVAAVPGKNNIAMKIFQYLRI